jgi:hypothetical protein
VVDDESDLVHMPRQHDPHRGFGIEDGQNVAMHVGGDAVGVPRHVVPVELRDRSFKAAW